MDYSVNPLKPDGTMMTRQELNTARAAAGLTPEKKQQVNQARVNGLAPYISPNAYKTTVSNGLLMNDIGTNGQPLPAGGFSVPTTATMKQVGLYGQAKSVGHNPNDPTDLLDMLDITNASTDKGTAPAGWYDQTNPQTDAAAATATFTPTNTTTNGVSTATGAQNQATPDQTKPRLLADGSIDYIAGPTGGGAIPVDKFAAVINRPVDAATETIEGRIQRLLAENNPVIQQAGNRALQQFAARGLLDSSMAIQAANEAMTAKAIEIAGPDAATYSKQGLANQSAANTFATQAEDARIKGGLLSQEYGLKGGLQAQSDAAALERARVTSSGDTGRVYADGITQINHDYTAMVNNIQQNTSLDPAQKEEAIQIQTQLRDQNIAAWNQTARALPGWTDQWAVMPATSPLVVSSSDASTSSNSSTVITATSPNPYPVGTTLYQMYEDSRPSTLGVLGV